jgi:hypothetical protein
LIDDETRHLPTRYKSPSTKTSVRFFLLS